MDNLGPTLTQNNSTENLVIVGNSAIQVNTQITKGSVKESADDKSERNSIFKMIDKSTTLRSSLLQKCMDNKVETKDSQTDMSQEFEKLRNINSTLN